LNFDLRVSDTFSVFFYSSVLNLIKVKLQKALIVKNKETGLTKFNSELATQQHTTFFSRAFMDRAGAAMQRLTTQFTSEMFEM